MSFKPDAKVRIQGKIVQCSVPGEAVAPGGKRADVSEFSQASRKRLMDIFAKIEVKGVRVTFVTLTFKGYPSYRKAKAALRRLLESWRRKYPKASAIWKMELQRRGSPHFHLMVFHLPFVKQAQLQEEWTCCTGETMSIAHLTLLRDHRQGWAYMSKYVAKVAPYLDNPSYPHRDLGKPGRWWGFHRKSALPFSDVYEDVDVPMEVFWRLRRYFRRFRPHLGGGAGGFTLYTDNAHQWLRLICRLKREYDEYAWG